MRTMFALYSVVIVAGIVAFVVVGLTQQHLGGHRRSAVHGQLPLGNPPQHLPHQTGVGLHRPARPVVRRRAVLGCDPVRHDEVARPQARREAAAGPDLGDHRTAELAEYVHRFDGAGGAVDAGVNHRDASPAPPPPVRCAEFTDIGELGEALRLALTPPPGPLRHQ